MTREFKFRIWDIDNKEFVNDICIHIDGSLLCDHGTTLHSNKFAVLQYTGLKDKNDKEIYEGDFLVFNMSDEISYVRIVEWDDNEPGFQFKISGSSFCKDNMKYCEIIGNIYENPNLLG